MTTLTLSTSRKKRGAEKALTSRPGYGSQSQPSHKTTAEAALYLASRWYPDPKVRKLLRGILSGSAAPDRSTPYLDKRVYGRDKEWARRPGTVIGTRPCRLGGCGQLCLIVKWPDGHKTYPCLDGMAKLQDGAYKIL